MLLMRFVEHIIHAARKKRKKTKQFIGIRPYRICIMQSYYTLIKVVTSI